MLFSHAAATRTKAHRTAQSTQTVSRPLAYHHHVPCHRIVPGVLTLNVEVVLPRDIDDVVSLVRFDRLNLAVRQLEVEHNPAKSPNAQQSDHTCLARCSSDPSPFFGLPFPPWLETAFPKEREPVGPTPDKLSHVREEGAVPELELKGRAEPRHGASEPGRADKVDRSEAEFDFGRPRDGAAIERDRVERAARRRADPKREWLISVFWWG